MVELYVVPSPESGEPEPDRNETPSLAPEAPSVLGDPYLDRLLSAAGQAAIQDGPPPPDPKAFMAKFWAKRGEQPPEDPTDPEPPQGPSVA